MMMSARVSRMWELKHVVLLVMVLLASAAKLSDGAGQTSVIRVGGIFNTYQEERVFEYSVEYVNRKEVMGAGVRMEYLINRTTHIETFKNIQLSCQQAEQGIVALIGSMTSTSTSAMAPVSSALRMPQITPTASNPHLDVHPYLMRMTAPDSMQSRALVDLVTYFGWTRMAILTSNTEYGIHGLTEFQTTAAVKGWKVISVQQFVAISNASQVNAREQLEVIKSAGVFVVILNCITLFSREVLKQAHELDMTSAGWAWVVTDGTTGAVDLFNELPVPEYMQGLVGTVPSIEHGRLWREFTEGWQQVADQSPTLPRHLDAESSKIADAVLTVAYALRGIHDSITTESLNCEDEPVRGWTYGELMLRSLKQVSGDGISSYISLNQQGAPFNPSYDIVNLKEDGWKKVGKWNQSGGLWIANNPNITFMEGRETVYDYISTLANRTIRVVTQEEPPFIRFTTDDYDYENVRPHQVEGFCMDLLDKLAETIGFDYHLYRVADGNFGLKDPITKQWNGVARDLVDRVADMAVLDYTITHVREQDMDFTTPFFDLGMSFIMKVPEEERVRPFKFLDPFSGQLWMSIIVTTFVVGLLVSMVNKMSPYDHHGEFIYVHNLLERNYMRKPNDYKFFKRLKVTALDKMNFTNSTWFSVASLLQQGGEFYPISPSGRTIGVIWWLSVVIIISTYTANLAAFLTASRSQTGINSVEDLASQSKVVYGLVGSSAPRQYFMDSQVVMYQDMMAFMELRDGLVTSTMKGVERARAGGYAYIYDSAVLDYFVKQKPCNNIQTVGRVFSKIGYGFGLQKNSPYKDELSAHILQLRENGFIDDLKHKWYIERSECGNADGGSSATAELIAAAGGQLDISHVLGVFYIVYGGLALSFLTLGIELAFASITAVDKKDEFNPSSLSESLRRRWFLIKEDFLLDIIPRIPYYCPRHPVTEDVFDMQLVNHADSRASINSRGSLENTGAVESNGSVDSTGALANGKRCVFNLGPPSEETESINSGVGRFMFEEVSVEYPASKLEHKVTDSDIRVSFVDDGTPPSVRSGSTFKPARWTSAYGSNHQNFCPAISNTSGSADTVPTLTSSKGRDSGDRFGVRDSPRSRWTHMANGVRS